MLHGHGPFPCPCYIVQFPCWSWWYSCLACKPPLRKSTTQETCGRDELVQFHLLKPPLLPVSLLVNHNAVCCWAEVYYYCIQPHIERNSWCSCIGSCINSHMLPLLLYYTIVLSLFAIVNKSSESTYPVCMQVGVHAGFPMELRCGIKQNYKKEWDFHPQLLRKSHILT